MDWIQADIYTSAAGIDPLGAVLLRLDAGGYSVSDSADFKNFLEDKEGKWDYVDEKLMILLDNETKMTAYFPEGEQGKERLDCLKSELERLKALDTEKRWGRLELVLTDIQGEDWATAWKRYYKPQKVGKRLCVCPSWEQYEPSPGETVIRLDPDMAFGTGTHDSTRLCMRLLEDHLPAAARVLDVGCGSGILAVSALLLGASKAVCVDISEIAVRIAEENAVLNGVAERCSFICGSLAENVAEQFDLIFANIVADVIIDFLPDAARLLAPGGVLITSGIIDTRESDVVRALAAHNLSVITRLTSGGWVGFCVRG